MELTEKAKFRVKVNAKGTDESQFRIYRIKARALGSYKLNNLESLWQKERSFVPWNQCNTGRALLTNHYETSAKHLSAKGQSSQKST